MKPSFILEECGQKQRKAGDQTIIIISPCSCVWSSNEKHWAGTRRDGRSRRTGISQKFSHERQTWNQCRKITQKLVKSFTCWVKTRMVEKHAHQHICQLHPVDPENEFAARKKKSVHIFPGFKVSAYSQKHVDVCLVASETSLWAYKRPGVWNGGHPRWPRGTTAALKDTSEFGGCLPDWALK